MSKSIAILSTAYLPPIQYFSKLVGYQDLLIEVNETYQKQSYRNRCIILSCNGPLNLSIPVIKADGNKTLTKDIRIDHSVNWQKNHWKAIESAYGHSAYFEFVSDILHPFYNRKEDFLIDYNDKIISEILSFIGVDKVINRTNEFVKQYSAGEDDFRFTIHPKSQYHQEDSKFSLEEYYQVFSDKFDFVPGLSIVDLLFNEGLNSLNIIETSIKK